MKLTILRKERDELIETLRDSECFEFDAPEDELLEDCCKGKRLDDFREECSWSKNGETNWNSVDHRRFYQVCHEIAELEQREYEKAMGRV